MTVHPIFWCRYRKPDDFLEAYFARIDEVNLKGPTLRAVLELNPSALTQAAALDKERLEKGPRSALHGIPVLLKDNIATIASEGASRHPIVEELEKHRS